MLDAVLASFLDAVTEREFDAPFMALLRALGFYDIHLLHGGYEYGKDFIAKRSDNGTLNQYVFQSKAGDLNLADWNRTRGQTDMLRRNQLAHPSFDLGLPRKAVFSTTGRLTGGAALEAQDHCRQIADRGEISLEIWDRERLIEHMRSALTVGLIAHTAGPLYGVLASIEDRSITDLRLETFSRRWFAVGQPAWASVLEAAILATQLEHTTRADLACYVGLTLVRAACRRIHGARPPDDEWNTVADLGRLIFLTYATTLWERRSEALDPSDMIRMHAEPAALITHAVRCVRLAEVVALLGLMPPQENAPPLSEVSSWLTEFIRRQTAAAYPISDRWAVALIPPVLLFAKTGVNERLADHLRNVLIWVTQRYGRGMVGLAHMSALPEEEAKRVVGNVVPPRSVERRSESYISTVLLDLTAFLRLGGLYGLVRDELRVINALPSVVTTEDTLNQYSVDGDDVSFEPNAPYVDHLGSDWTSAAPHLARAIRPRYLQEIGRSWDHLAVSAVLRDRHFVSAWPDLVG